MSLRLFAALPIPDDVADRIVAIQRGVSGAAWRPREALHLTLRFFGEVAEPVADDIDSELDEMAQRHGPLDIALKGVGMFGKDDPHTLWLGVAENKDLRALAADAERAARRAGLKPEARKFTPHVTAAYLHHPDLDRVRAFEQRHALFESKPWRADAFHLYSSWRSKSGPSHYRLEAEYPLMG
jgi:RNA 2',3'-cyclic 3'-phosphodiesterase